jgi:hypothetical protein
MTASYGVNPELLNAPALLVIAAMHYTGLVADPNPNLGNDVYSESPMAPLSLSDIYSENIAMTEEAQAEILGGFARKLLENAQDPPQEIVELLNKHFWELL